jgi:hypothetical protein
MRRKALLIGGASAAALIALAVIFAPYAIGQRKDADPQAIGVAKDRPFKGEAVVLTLKNGRRLFVAEPRLKYIAGRAFVSGKALDDLGGPDVARWVAVDEVVSADEYDNARRAITLFREAVGKEIRGR